MKSFEGFDTVQRRRRIFTLNLQIFGRFNQTFADDFLQEWLFGRRYVVIGFVVALGVVGIGRRGDRRKGRRSRRILRFSQFQIRDLKNHRQIAKTQNGKCPRRESLNLRLNITSSRSSHKDNNCCDYWVESGKLPDRLICLVPRRTNPNRPLLKPCLYIN